MVLTIHQNVGISFKLQFLLSIWVVLYEIRTNVVSFWKLYTFDFVALLTFALLACAFLKQLQLFYTCSFEVKCVCQITNFWCSQKHKNHLEFWYFLRFDVFCSVPNDAVSMLSCTLEFINSFSALRFSPMISNSFVGILYFLLDFLFSN